MEKILHISHSMWNKINKSKNNSNFIKSSIESFTRFSEFFPCLKIIWLNYLIMVIMMLK
jgi:hypothetical protein